LKTLGRRNIFKIVADNAQQNCPARKWTKRAGIIAFLFFLGKGLIWLAAILLGAYYTLN
jgi:hypothetical protein